MKIKRTSATRCAMILIAMCCAVPALQNTTYAKLASTDNNFNNEIVGGRAMGMGGAFTAISDDPSGMYYNPAGLVFASSNQVSLSVNTYKGKTITYDKVFVDNPYKQDISSLIPSMFGLVQSLGKYKIGISIITLNNEVLDQDNKFKYKTVFGTTDFNINYNLNDKTILGGLSFASFITDYISIGFTMSLLWRRTEEIATQMTYNDIATDEYVMQNDYVTREMWGLTGKLGIQIMPIDMLALGLSLGYGGIFTESLQTQSYNSTQTAGNVFVPPTIVRYNGAPARISTLPFELRVGIAVFPTKKIVVSADFIADFCFDYYYYQTPVQLVTMNGALGLEYYATNSLPIRVGFFTNFSNIPTYNKNWLNQETRVDMYGVTLGLGWETRSSSISLSGSYQFGWGQSQLIANNYNTQDVTMHAYMISLSGAAKY